MAAYLVAEEGPLAGMIVRMEEGNEWTLGRDPDEVTIALEDPMVSRKHVICRQTPEGYLLENLSSVNPATQNGKVITDSVLLTEGDILQIGSTFFRFSEHLPSLQTPADITQAEEALSFDSNNDLSTATLGNGSLTRWLIKAISGPNAGGEFQLEKSTTYIIGKDPTLSDIVFQDLSVSRQHAKIEVTDSEEVFIEDLGSRNGLIINGELCKERRKLQTQDLISIGTTSFIVVDRDLMEQTLLAAPALISPAAEQMQEIPEAKEQEPTAKHWKQMIIPTKHLVVAGCFCLVLLVLIASIFSLFKVEQLPVYVKNESEQIQEATGRFSDVQFTFNESSGKLFLLGHVLTPIEKQELMYSLQNLSFITSIEDNIVIDEYVWQNMNALLLTNPSWQSVAIHSPSPGRFIIKGYVETLEQAESLSEYLNINFPYLDRLQNQVVVQNNLNMQIQGLLIEKGFNGVTFQITAGELVLAGRVDDKSSKNFNDLLANLKALPGIRQVKNFVVYTSEETSRVDISQQYQVTGFSQGTNASSFAVINGKVLSIGDILDGMSITGIQSNAIFLEKDGLKYRINYNLQ